MSPRSDLDKIMQRIQALDPCQDYDVGLVLPTIASDLGYGNIWIAEHLPEIESGVALYLQEDGASSATTATAPKWHFYLDPTKRVLRSRRLDNPGAYDAVQAKLSWLNSLRSSPAVNAEIFEAACQEAIAKALPPAAMVTRTRLHTDKGIDVYGNIPFQNGLGSIFLLCQVKLQDVQGGAEIRTFYGAAQYLLHARIGHRINRMPQDLQDFLRQMPLVPPVVLVFCAATYSPEARDECNVLGVRHFDFRWIASQLARNPTLPH